MYIESRPVTGYGDTAGWAGPLQPSPKPGTRPPFLKGAASYNSLAGMEQVIKPDNLRPPARTANSSASSLNGRDRSVPRFQDFVKRAPPHDPAKPLPPTPLRVPRRSSYDDSPSASSREALPMGARRASSVYSRTVSQWIPDSPVWTGSDFADEPLPALPQQYLQPIAYSASTPQLVERPPTPPLLEPRTYQPLLATPSPTVSRATTPSPTPRTDDRPPRPSILLPMPLESPKIERQHLRTVSLEKAKAAAQSPGAEHLLPEELRARSHPTRVSLIKSRSFEPLVRTPTERPKQPREAREPIVRDTLAMFRVSPESAKTPPELPTLTLIDAEGRDRVVGSPRASVAPLPAFAFPEPPMTPTSPPSFDVGSHAPKFMAPLADQPRQQSKTKLAKALGLQAKDDGRGRARTRGPHSPDLGYYIPDRWRPPSPTSSSEDEGDAHQVAKEYHSLLTEQYRQQSSSPAATSVNSEGSVREHLRMVPQPLFTKPQAMPTGGIRPRYDSPNSSVSPGHRREQSDSSVAIRPGSRGHDRSGSLPLTIYTHHKGRQFSENGDIPISPPFDYNPYTLPDVPQARSLPKHRRNSYDNRVSAYFPIMTKGSPLKFRRSDERKKSLPGLRSPKSPLSPGRPLLAADIIAQRLQTPASSPLNQTPPTSHKAPKSDASSVELTAKELRAKQALLSRITKGAVKYADLLTRPAAQIPATSARKQPTRLHIPPASAFTNAEARADSPHLLPSPKSPGLSLGWSAAAKHAFDAQHPGSPTHQPSHASNNAVHPAALYTHTLLPARPLDERGTGLAEDEAAGAAGRRRGSLFGSLMDFRKEAKAEKRREEIKRTIRVVQTPEAAGERRRSASLERSDMMMTQGRRASILPVELMRTVSEFAGGML